MKKIVIKLKGCGHKRFYELLKEEGLLHDLKNTDYASEEDPLGNFHRVGLWIKLYNLNSPGMEPVKIAIIYMLKQLDAALILIGKNKKGQVETVPKRFQDVSVYSKIISILYEEENK